MAAGGESGDEEEDAKINVSSQDNGHRLKVIGTKKRNCKYLTILKSTAMPNKGHVQSFDPLLLIKK